MLQPPVACRARDPRRLERVLQTTPGRVDVQVQSDGNQFAVPTHRRDTGDVDGPPDEVHHVPPHPPAGLHGHPALDPVRPRGRIFQQVDEQAGLHRAGQRTVAAAAC